MPKIIGGGSQYKGKFKITVDFCGNEICSSFGQNKKESKNNCAKLAL